MRAANRHIDHWLAVAIACAAAPAAMAGSSPPAESAAPDGPQTLVQSWARPLVRTAPTYPMRALEERDEGTVVLSYVVTPEGTVADPVVETSSGNRLLDRAAIDAVSRWRYEPATRNGEPIEQCEVRTTLNFVIQKPGRGALSPRFRRELRELSELAAAGRADEATAQVERLIETRSIGQRRINIYEWMRLWVLKGALDTQVGAPPAQIVDSLRRALNSPSMLGNDELHRALLENLLKHEIDLHEYGRAAATLGDLLNLVPVDERPDWMRQVTEEMTALLLDQRPLSRPGQIPATALAEDQQPFWSHQPLRRQFRIEDTAGELSAVDIRCEWQRSLGTWTAGHTWQLPADWGNCDVYVYGEPGTTFTLVEYPLT